MYNQYYEFQHTQPATSGVLMKSRLQFSADNQENCVWLLLLRKKGYLMGPCPGDHGAVMGLNNVLIVLGYHIRVIDSC